MEIGDKIVGFKFRTNVNITFDKEMVRYVGKIGIIKDIYDDDDGASVKVCFYDDDGKFDDMWYYPKKQAEKHLVHESNDMFPIY